MKVLDRGHLYQLAVLDGPGHELLRFVKRVGDRYPGNAEPAYPGVTMQEVLRALIDRNRYVDSQQQCAENRMVRHHLSWALAHLEWRAARVRGEKIITPADITDLASQPTCRACGHVQCGVHQ